MRHPKKYGKSLWVTYLFTVGTESGAKPLKGIYTNKLFLVFSRLFHGNNRVAHVRWYCSRRDHGQYPKCRCLSSSDIRLYYHFYFNYPAEQGAIEVSEFPKSGDFD